MKPGDDKACLPGAGEQRDLVAWPVEGHRWGIVCFLRQLIKALPLANTIDIDAHRRAGVEELYILQAVDKHVCQAAPSLLKEVPRAA